MIFKNFSPSHELAGLVKSYHVRHFEFSPKAKIPFKAFPPRGEQYLIFYVKGCEKIYLQKDQETIIRNKATLVGQSTQLVYRMVSPQFLIIQVPFYPGALHRLTGIPFEELKDKSLDFELLFPIETREIEEKLQGCRSYEAMVQLVDQLLIVLFRKKSSMDNHPSERALPYFFISESIQNVDFLADEACLSLRQFERLSKKYFGVGPKTMLRINRFSKSYIFKTKNPELSWYEVSAACGYEDYQHMAKDYKDFSGITPAQLWDLDTLSPDRILGLR
ncbi:AraC family transcriptional regulator [Algoriphagus boseongensis]|uniref:AraC family transcriptional regulator n=1 Tax=Algoriphagus boseongensis TaxID=1442587 RepID=A0A4R6T6S0_9BACT|nr:helix-turn-helix domain-containing protein [Algoriphagus boseongensis]TDQ16668.1 AraC family transcriptional regulator [Algoriphagus boseongensis]